MTAPDSAALLIPELPQDLLERPLEYIIADHDRHRAVCAYLKRVVRQEAIDGASARILSAFLRGAVKRHFEDEKLSLFPALLARSGDDLDFVHSLQKIEDFHAGSEILIDHLVERLERIPSEGSTQLAPELAGLLADYAAQEHQNLAFENSVIMVIAGVRLKKGDIEKIRTGMKARRGLMDSGLSGS